nr:hypothetical protein BC332_11812 [Ipomoea trifida]
MFTKRETSWLPHCRESPKDSEGSGTAAYGYTGQSQKLLRSPGGLLHCPDSPNNSEISSFLCFMDSLINNAEDVKELRSKGVVFNYLGTDQDVAELFNQISRDLVPNPHAYAQVKRDIQTHCDKKARVFILDYRMEGHVFQKPLDCHCIPCCNFRHGLERLPDHLYLHSDF